LAKAALRGGHSPCTLILDEQRRRSKRDLDAKLLAGREGPAVDMTREDWESIRREAIDGLSGEPIRP
jgi:hypothetical protein